jgi:hypothetical protein
MTKNIVLLIVTAVSTRHPTRLHTPPAVCGCLMVMTVGRNLKLYAAGLSFHFGWTQEYNYWNSATSQGSGFVTRRFWIWRDRRNQTSWHRPLVHMLSASKIAQEVTLLTLFLKVRGSNLGPDIGYRDWDFLWLARGKFWGSNTNYDTTASFHIFPLFNIFPSCDPNAEVTYLQKH